jgi:hypothetical protein
MSKENAENIQPAPVAPAPAVAEPVAKAPANGAVSAPVESPTEKQEAKVTAAFIKQRQETRELKAKLAAATASAPPPAVPAAPAEQPIAKIETPSPAPAQIQAANGIEEESKKAIEALAKDPDIGKIPGAIIDILEMVDNDARLSRLHGIDPVLAFREAKGVYMANAGIAPAPAVPKSSTPSGGMGGGHTSLEALIADCERYTPGTKEFYTAAKKVEAEMRKLPRL